MTVPYESLDEARPLIQQIAWAEVVDALTAMASEEGRLLADRLAELPGAENSAPDGPLRLAALVLSCPSSQVEAALEGAWQSEWAFSRPVHGYGLRLWLRRDQRGLPPATAVHRRRPPGRRARGWEGPSTDSRDRGP